MVWDLRRALLKKEEFESARLMDFDFRLRARATRLLAQAYALDETALVGTVALHDEDGVVALVATQTGTARHAVQAEYLRCLISAREALIAERGDPTPHRLA
ncbi:MAG: hypothetical protein E6R12_05900 [Sphingomonadales bacterium]|nr:MAG: hypothetical protein E6R12_05900 [Sphingomonadales bacterium]